MSTELDYLASILSDKANGHLRASVVIKLDRFSNELLAVVLAADICEWLNGEIKFRNREDGMRLGQALQDLKSKLKSCMEQRG